MHNFVNFHIDILLPIDVNGANLVSLRKIY